MPLTHRGSCDEKLPAEKARVDAPQPERREAPAAALLGLLPSAVRETHPRGPRDVSARRGRKETFPGCELGWTWKGSKKVGCALNSRLSEIGTALGPGISANLSPGRGDSREELGKT